MSRIDDLIKKLCPDGVEFRAIGKVVLKTENIRWNENHDIEFQYIDLSSVDRDTHAIAETSTITSDNAPSRAQQIVLEGDVVFGTTRPMLKRYTTIPSQYDNQICSTGFCVLRPNKKVVLTNFLFHMLGTAGFYKYVERNERGANYPAIPDRLVKAFKIPVPPLPVQEEIVDILDKFTKLEAELEAELEMRQKQYTHYREELLNLEGTDVKQIALGDIYEFKYGTGNTIPQTGGDYPVYGSNGVVGSHDEFNSEDSPVIGHIGAYAGIVNWGKGKHFVTYNGVICRIKSKEVLPQYGYYLLLLQDFRSKANSGSQPFVSYHILNAPIVPVPSIGEQERIVAILDKFDALVNDISNGLPAEISARRQQYEYYRDKLLTFKEAA